MTAVLVVGLEIGALEPGVARARHVGRIARGRAHVAVALALAELLQAVGAATAAMLASRRVRFAAAGGIGVAIAVLRIACAQAADLGSRLQRARRLGVARRHARRAFARAADGRIGLLDTFSDARFLARRARPDVLRRVYAGVRAFVERAEVETCSTGGDERRNDEHAELVPHDMKDTLSTSAPRENRRRAPRELT